MDTRVLLTDRQRTHKLDTDRLRSALARIAGDIWESPVEISLILLGRRAMAAANRKYRGYLGTTDQISFPMPQDQPVARDGVALVGDLLVCPAVVAGQSESPPPDGRPVTGTPDLELALVICHGLLHLAGHTHDDPTGTAAMVKEERRLFEAHASLLDKVFST
jgi:probable rRNA maturation factor